LFCDEAEKRPARPAICFTWETVSARVCRPSYLATSEKTIRFIFLQVEMKARKKVK
jgi:hypothetical protein